MVLNPPIDKTPFEDAYEALCAEDKYRVRTCILAICGISRKTFYDWMKSPQLISPGDRFHIANVFGKNIEDLFIRHSEKNKS